MFQIDCPYHQRGQRCKTYHICQQPSFWFTECYLNAAGKSRRDRHTHQTIWRFEDGPPCPAVTV